MLMTLQESQIPTDYTKSLALFPLTQTILTKTTAQRAIAFIDSSVENYQSLIAGVVSGTEVVVLDSNQDGVEQITEILSDRTDINSLHIVSHGSPGCLYLGNSELSLDTLNHYTNQLKTWAVASSNIFLYGCQVAAGDAGEEFLSKLHHLTKANIAASANLTGSADQGGDWELEVIKGNIKTSLVFEPQVREAYAGVLGTFTVTTANDDGDGEDTGLSLREAIALANASEGEDTIVFDSSLSGEIITLTLGELGITDDLIIDGLGADQLTISANHTSRIFNINDGDASNQINVEIEGLTITDGNSDEGAGIFSTENLTITESTVTDNTAQIRGGGIFNDGGTLTVIESTVSNNTALTRSGGGISNTGVLNIIDSNVTGNSAATAGGAIANNSTGVVTVTNSTLTANTAVRFGGAIANSGTVTINESVVSDNTATSLGGGIFNDSGNLIVNDSTLSGNTAQFGGAIHTQFFGTATINDSTISGNTATTGGGAIVNADSVLEVNDSTITDNTAPIGGGVVNVDTTAPVPLTPTTTVTNSIIAGNDNNDIAGIGENTDFISGGNNIIGNGDGAGGLTDDVNDDLVGTTDNPIDPFLGSLSNSLYIRGDSSNNNLSGKSGNDSIKGLEGNDTLSGGAGNDTLKGGKYNDQLWGGSDDDLLKGNQNNDTLYGGTGDDTLKGGKDNDRLVGGSGDDTLKGDQNNDTLYGGTGNDALEGGKDNDELWGGSGNDFLKGDQNNDTLYGGTGNDSLEGGKDNDELLGGSGDDLLKGGQGDDLLRGGYGNDTLRGGQNADIFILALGEGTDTIEDFRQGADRIGLAGGLMFSDLNFSGDNIMVGSETLAIVTGMDTTTLNSWDFTIVV